MRQQDRFQLEGEAPEMYQRDHVPAVFAAWAPILVDLAQPVTGEFVIDAACGTGVIARVVARRVGRTGKVCGLDINAGMLEVARKVTVAEPDAAPVEWIEASADALPLADSSYDIIYCQAGLMFVPDPLRALCDFRRVLRSEGRVALLVWHSSPVHFAVAVALGRHVNDAAAAIVRAPYSLADPNEVEALLHAARFRDLTVTSQTGTIRYQSSAHYIRSFFAGTPVGRSIAELDPARRDELLAELETNLAPYEGSRGLVAPITANLAFARK